MAQIVVNTGQWVTGIIEKVDGLQPILGNKAKAKNFSKKDAESVIELVREYHPKSNPLIIY